MTQGAQVGGALPALVGLFDLRGWPRSSWGQASFKLALPRATCGRRLFPWRLEGMSRVCTQHFSLSLAAGGAHPRALLLARSQPASRSPSP